LRIIPQFLLDIKFGEGNLVWVRVPPPAPRKSPAKVQKTQGKAKGQISNPGPFYTNYYTNALRQGVLHRFGSLTLHVGQHVRVSIEGYGDGDVA